MRLIKHSEAQHVGASHSAGTILGQQKKVFIHNAVSTCEELSNACFEKLRAELAVQVCSRSQRDEWVVAVRSARPVLPFTRC